MTQELLNDEGTFDENKLKEDNLDEEDFDEGDFDEDNLDEEDFDEGDFDEDTFSDEDIVSELDISHLVIEDDTPVDNFQSELQQRLLVEPLYSSQALPSPFLAAANVGLFYKLKGDPVVPDAMLSLGVQRAEDFSEKRNRTYLVWEFGKLPEVCIEIVSNTEGDELALSQKSRKRGKTIAKKDLYSQIGIRYYVVFNPLQQIQGSNEMNGALLRVWSISPEGYPELTPPQGISSVSESVWLNAVGLGLTLWEGKFEEDVSRLWLRWCDRSGQVILTGAERADLAEARAESAEAKARRLAERLRALGINPEEV
ncbi:MAG: Uma2 family endonuclease [Oculatellaceae cyanobacterium Prado106]|nr:Uma2 family endonuclease [Oculatellaceae cyanobacterium Prado106]